MTKFKVGDRVRILRHYASCDSWYIDKTAKITTHEHSNTVYTTLYDSVTHVHLQLEALYPGQHLPIQIFWPVEDLELLSRPGDVTSTEGGTDADLDEFHYHEALDRTHMLLVMLEESLEQHPVLEKHPALKDLYFEIDEKLGRLYQDIANFRPGKD